MFRKKFAVLPVFLLLLFTLAISGCIQLGEEEAPAKYGKGLGITSFEAVPSTVFSGDSYDLMLDLQNKGGDTARQVNVYIYSPKEYCKGLGNLDPPTEQFKGEQAMASRSLDAPDIPKGITSSVTPRVRVYYKYKTLGRVNIPVLSKSEYKRRWSQDEEMPSKGPTLVSRGPFSLEIKPAQSPALVEDGDSTFRFYISAENLGAGTPYEWESSPDWSTGPGWSTDCLGIPSGEGFKEIEMSIKVVGDASLSDCGSYSNKFHEIRIRKGETLEKSCKIDVTSPERPFQEISVQVTLRYGYFISDTTEVTIKGEEEVTAPVTEEQPDLQVEEIDLDPSDPDPGDSVTITATIKNAGDEDVGSFKVRFKNGTTQIDDEQVISSLGVGDTDQESVEWTALPSGDQTIKVVADSQDDIDESNEDNNEKTKDITV